MNSKDYLIKFLEERLLKTGSARYKYAISNTLYNLKQRVQIKTVDNISKFTS